MRYWVGMGTITLGLSASFVHHLVFGPAITGSLLATVGSFIPSLLAIGGALPLLVYVHRSDVDESSLGRGAVWYLGGALLFAVGIFVSLSVSLDGPMFEPELLFSVANWSIAGSFVGLVVANYDVRRTNAMATARANRRRADRIAQRLSVLNRVLRHDVRNKTTIILGNAELLRTDRADAASITEIEDAAGALAEIADRARRVQSIVEDESVGPLEVPSCLADCVDDLRSTYPDARITTEIVDPVTVRTFPAFRSVVAELLENAIQHADSSTPAVDVTIRRLPTSPGMAELVVTDDGPGIPERERLVETDDLETPLDHSRGTSLWLTRWIVDESGGELSIDSADGGGTVVRIRLPTAHGTAH